MKETALLFGPSRSLVGIVSEPAEPRQADSRPAVLLLNAGLVHRVGPQRIYVKMARHLTILGFTVLRFDFSGIGDSKARRDHLPFVDSSVAETCAAMDWLHRLRGVERFMVIGICSGAAVSFATACRDSRIVGVLLINPAAVHLHESTDEPDPTIAKRAMSRHFWQIALFSSFRAQNFFRMLTGRVDYLKVLKGMNGFSLANLFQNSSKSASAAAAFESKLRMLRDRGVRPCYFFAEGDEGLDYLNTLCGARLADWCGEKGLMTMEIIAGANHTFTMLWSQQALLAKVENWAKTFAEGARS